MSFNYRLILLSCLLCSFSAYAFEGFIDPLYWRVTEPIDWAYVNSMTTPNQVITYKTLTYPTAPGLRAGGKVNLQNNWDTQFYFTTYSTHTSDTVTGNLKSAFLGAKLAEPTSDYFYQAGQVSSSIHYNMLDWNAGKHFDVTSVLILRPLIGVEGGWINQTFDSTFQGSTSITEKIDNDFTGIGPKIGIEGKLIFLQKENYQGSLLATFATAYLIGNWKITDTAIVTPPRDININIGTQKLGSFSAQALVGVGFDYKNFSIKASYEINDWFNQCQIFDNDTGAHNNDLILQGVTVSLAYRF